MRDDGPDSRGNIQCFQQLMLRVLFTLAQRQQHCRHHAAGTCRRRGNDAAHACVRLRHGKRLHDDLIYELPTDAFAAARVQPHFQSVAADQSAHAALRTGVGIGCVLDRLPGGKHFGH